MQAKTEILIGAALMLATFGIIAAAIADVFR